MMPKFKVAYKSPYTKDLIWIKKRGKIELFKTPRIALKKATKKAPRFAGIFVVKKVRK